MIGVTRDGNVLTLEMQRPERRNAISVEMHEEIAPLFHRISTDPEVDVVVLTGAGAAIAAAAQPFLHRRDGGFGFRWVKRS